MEVSIKERNLTVIAELTEDTAKEAIVASLDIISRIFGSGAVVEAFKAISME